MEFNFNYMSKEAKGHNIYLGEQEIGLNQVTEKVTSILNNFEINDELKTSLFQEFNHLLKNAYSRRKREGRDIDKAYLSGLISNLTGRLEIQASEISRQQTEKKEVLNPHLLNRSGANKAYDQMIENPNIEPGKKEYITFISIDLDDFKPINDKYGHVSGDNVLKSFGQSLGTVIRTEDLGIHFSGDEFGIILKFSFDEDMDEEEARDNIQRIISEKISMIQNKMNPKRPDGTEQQTSTGFHIIPSGTKPDFEDVREKADKASETSKLLKILKAKESSGRVVDFSQIEKIETEFNPEDIKKAQIIRGLKREITNAYPDLSPEEINSMLEPLVSQIMKTIEQSSNNN